MAKLSTHVLDTARGRPGRGIKVELFKLIAEQRQHLVATVTNDDGRTAGPLLEGEQFQAGAYELDFHLGPYFADLEGSFLDVVTVRFNVAAGENYHVPLLASPYGYTTYRGS